MAKCRRCGKPAPFALELCQECTDAAITHSGTTSVRPEVGPLPGRERSREIWKCRICGEDVEAVLAVCWSCQGARGNTRSVKRRSAHALTEQLEKRYGDAYRVARATILLGGVAKALAFVFALISVVFALAVYEWAGATALVGGLFGVFAGLLLYVVGVLVAAHGQLLLTSIDGVINTSPFLTDSERAAIMRVALVEAEEMSGNVAGLGSA